MSERLIRALDEVKTLPVITLGNIVDKVQEEALLILCIVCIIPFMQPIPIPGLSTLLGLVILLQGIGLLLWGKPLLTARLKLTVITHEKFDFIHKGAKKFSAFASVISLFKHPIVNSRGSQILAGLSVICLASFLSLPLPIPFSNFVPAMGIFILCIGLLEDDVMLMVIGHGVNALVIWMAMASYHLILEKLQSWF